MNASRQSTIRLSRRDPQPTELQRVDLSAVAGSIDFGWWTEPLMPLAEKLSDRPLVYTTADMANLLGTSEKTIRRMDQEGRLPAPVRNGRSVRWPSADIDRWIDAGMPPRDEWNARNVPTLARISKAGTN